MFDPYFCLRIAPNKSNYSSQAAVDFRGLCASERSEEVDRTTPIWRRGTQRALHAGCGWCGWHDIPLTSSLYIRRKAMMGSKYYSDPGLKSLDFINFRIYN